MGLVKFGRAHLPLFLNMGRRLLVCGQSAGVALVPQGRKLVALGRSVGPTLVRQSRKPVLFFQWGRIPREWELSFVAEMKSMESRGIAFPVVLHTSLPSVIGDGPSEVLLRWVGGKARSQPKQFVKVVDKMFGPSGKRIITGLEHDVDPQEMLKSHEEPEEPFQSSIDAIQRVDATKPNQPKPLQKDRWKQFSA